MGGCRQILHIFEIFARPLYTKLSKRYGGTQLYNEEVVVMNVPKQRVLPEDWKEFVHQSEMLAQMYPAQEDPEWVIQVKHHEEIAHILAFSHRLIHPILVNGALLYERERLYRSGSPRILRHSALKALSMEQVVDRVFEWINRTFTLQLIGTKEEKELISWKIHDGLMWLDAFREGNGRTARLYLNHVRTQLGLPVYIIRETSREKYFARIDSYDPSEFIAGILSTEESALVGSTN